MKKSVKNFLFDFGSLLVLAAIISIYVLLILGMELDLAREYYFTALIAFWVLTELGIIRITSIIFSSIYVCFAEYSGTDFYAVWLILIISIWLFERNNLLKNKRIFYTVLFLVLITDNINYLGLVIFLTVVIAIIKLLQTKKINSIIAAVVVGVMAALLAFIKTVLINEFAFIKYSEWSWEISFYNIIVIAGLLVLAFYFMKKDSDILTLRIKLLAQISIYMIIAMVVFKELNYELFEMVIGMSKVITMASFIGFIHFIQNLTYSFNKGIFKREESKGRHHNE